MRLQQILTSGAPVEIVKTNYPHVAKKLHYVLKIGIYPVYSARNVNYNYVQKEDIFHRFPGLMTAAF